MMLELLDEALSKVEDGADVSILCTILSATHSRTGSKVEDGADVSILGDGAHCPRQDIVGCAERNVTPNPKANITSGTGSRGTGCAWGREVQKQLGGGPGRPVGRLSRKEREANLEEWKKNVGYGKRRIVEIVFSAFKRMFGDHLYSKKWYNMVREADIKVATYNRWVREALAAAWEERTRCRLPHVWVMQQTNLAIISNFA